MFKRLSITFWATVFVSVVCVSLVAIDGWRSWNARAEHLLDMERVTSNLARSMAQQANDAIKATDVVLTDLVERIEADGTDKEALARIQTQMMAQLANLPQLDGLSVFDSSGRWIVNSRSVSAPVFSSADREYFVHHRDHAQRGTHVGLPLRSRFNGHWVIPVSRRLNRPDGSFGGVVLATLDVDYFRRFYQSFDIGKRGSVALLSADGVILLRRPFGEEYIGRDIRNSEMYKAYLSTGVRGSGAYVSPQDGELRLGSFQPLENYPLYVTAALSKEEMLERWRSDTFLHSMGVMLLAVLLGFFGKRLIGQIHLRLQAENELLQTRDALESVNRTLERQAMQDGLTGLANRRQFDVTLGNEFSRAMRYQTTLAFIMIDVDYFKQYNDLYGHAAGDDCLRAVSKLIRAVTPKRPGDLTARYGGEEIGILLPNTDAEGARAVAERIRHAIGDLRLEHSGSPLGYVTLSAGVATMRPRRGVHLAAMLVEAADRALYVAKSAGRNRVAAEGDPAAGAPAAGEPAAGVHTSGIPDAAAASAAAPAAPTA